MKTPAAYRKHLPRKHHRERAQLSGRQKFGFLEKHQDYVKRARDFHKKRDAIRKLKEKAAFRNPDEFYYAMEKTQRKGGIHQSIQKGKERTHDEVTRMQSEDINYLNLKHTQEMKKIENMQGSLQMIRDVAPEKIQKRHTVFVDSEESVDEFDPEEYFETPKALLTRSYNRPSRETLESGDILINGESITSDDLQKLEKQKKRSYEELAARIVRRKKIKQNLQSLQLKKALTQNGNVNKKQREGKEPVFKWRKQRSK
eukprot:TRINITY_DN1886_c0_g1_i2.p1 TRINITY_DN1886_c0_g1~~TRINITY_DN1886_c0_g1_i2.p1  ORF type:complete len:257 (+),score=62.71 TRINITY_DN1886_c0_g1_i2:78-848(+)